MSDLIYSVKEIFTDYLKNNGYLCFNIPDYQRGYKWDANDVTKLLDDLKKFEQSTQKSDDFYCLQNITLVESIAENKIQLNVVDGQQRLTTLYILLSFYKNCKGESFEFTEDILKYSIREGTSEKLQEIYQNKDCIWDKLNPAEAKHRDEFYILTVAKTIYGWFFSIERIEKKTLKFDIVWEKLKLIVNKIEGKTEEKVFANINCGKVPLDGADLVRAILMTRSAKEKFAENNSKEKTNEFRVRMGIEIDNINQWWSNDDVNDYFTQFLSGQNQNNGIFKNDFPINLLYKLYYETHSNNKNSVMSFDFFEYGSIAEINSNYKMYQDIISLHLTLKDWYNNQEIYHLLGYLFFNFKDGHTISMNIIWNNQWKQSNSKSEFVAKLKSLITDKLLGYSESEENDQSDSKKTLLENIENVQYDWYDDQLTIKLLPLMDVIYFLDKNKGRLKVPYFRANGEDREHIMCQNPRQGEDEKGIRREDAIDFLKTYFSNINGIADVQELIQEIENGKEYLSNKNKSKFDELLHRHSLNSIGNIVLLDLSVNRSYGNAPHNEKVARITSDFFGNWTYIRPFTAEVFMEKDKPNEKWHWGITEITNNAKNISCKIANFLNWER